ncbi:endolytic transglycosylase MltG [Actinobacteria bacterium YIM 96077]|uniref:Endolytic murein transglycosylase n=1 Tax=Phytoactinopolyspora halophila TaxID=1981511 RepID=A0A329QFV1_9ACTN|nr:endolytic transglycosylase MltG [Phytoactinopolyspora halophila]AYY13447.1 endolytic transglycosylase MltG [Actinobacteria bacterium YIM 96077]RAW10841.1 endolytic transglycosylase MltG [Phytoactinopolyspora halophila]
MTRAESPADTPPGRRRAARRKKRKKRRLGSFMAVVLSLAVVGGLIAGLYYGGSAVINAMSGFISDPEDYPGPGFGEVTVTIDEGATLRAMGSTLAESDVVASQQAFIHAAERNPGARQIQPGTYTLSRKMSADDAVETLVETGGDHDQIVIPEGFRQDQILERLAQDSEFEVEEFEEALDTVDLPDYADGEFEGFLFPATYELRADATPESLVQAMIDRFEDAEQSLDLGERAQEIDRSLYEVVTVASIVQREVRRDEDMPRVAEVIYNRLDGQCADAGVGNRLLQMDSTVHYAANDYSTVFTSAEMREIDSPYNTYRNPGLPPGPIAAPGEAALEAAVDPVDEGNCFFVTVNVETGETKFAPTETEHESNVQEMREYCRESGNC